MNKSFYSLSKEDRENLVRQIQDEVLVDIKAKKLTTFEKYATDEDTYIRKALYLGIGTIYLENIELQDSILPLLEKLLDNTSELARQTAVNALGEIGKIHPLKILPSYEKAMKDENHRVRNAVIGSLKKIGEIKPKEVILFAKKFLHDPDPEVRRQVIHGIELRGRTHPEEVLPLLKESQNETKARVRNMVVHVVGQISYKKGCLEKVLNDLATWENKDVVKKCLAEIIETHDAYKEFSYTSPEEARKQIKSKFNFK